ncbi:hypothetical protein ACIBAC_15080 [Streptomyces sp. NPDC051362]|uniref:hypothetical protein n=1 Tax=Streptomyces sp. NPDC051362 TaxID=3365651 RepID=UPI0037A1D5A0
MTTRPAFAAAVDSAASAGTCGYAPITGQPCPVHTKPEPVPADRHALITLAPQTEDPDLLTIAIDSRGIHPSAVAYALRQAAEQIEREALGDEHQADEEQHPTDWVDEVRQALAFNARATAHPAVITLRDVLLDTAERTPGQALDAACILLAAHTRELSRQAEDQITAHRAETPKGRDVRALRTGMASIRRLLDEAARRLDPKS